MTENEWNFMEHRNIRYRAICSREFPEVITPTNPQSKQLPRIAAAAVDDKCNSVNKSVLLKNDL